ncbi:MAG: HAMP domain-containing sensor histidine kinase, partial [Porphyromonas sp.]|nr:HAMP domain-containing sensor histidine kinase [Porphyromonas sp.]
MRKSIIWPIVVLAVVTLVGLLVMQINYVSIMYDSRAEQFNSAVRRALANVSKQLEYDEARRILQSELLGRKVSVTESNPVTDLLGSGSSLYTSTIDPKLFQLDQLPEQSQSHWVAKKEDQFVTTSAKLQEELRKKFQYEKEIINEVILDMITQNDELPIYERISRAQLKNALAFELESNGINLYYVYDVVDKNDHSYFSTGKIPKGEAESTFTQLIFKKDRPSRYLFLRVYFPGRGDYLYEAIDFWVPSAIFTILVLGMFVYTAIRATRQRKLAIIKSDFVNNMTHELKTPVSTIRLANEFLMDNNLNLSREQIQNRLKVIDQETKRLSNLVDQVLYTSLLDKNSTVLKMEELDIQELILEIANTYSIKVEGLGGVVDIELDATENDVFVNRTHMTNIITNLLDNAIKYRREDVPLELKIGTANEGDKLCIYVLDNGIGIKKEYLKKIFERFF